MNEIKHHKDLDVWKISMDFVVYIYDVTKTFPKDEVYALTSQMRRAAVSIPSNIAEGAARAGNKEFAHFLYIALGSLAEIDTQIAIATRLNYMADENVVSEITKIRNYLSALIKSIK